jgi:hypothetical protein
LVLEESQWGVFLQRWVVKGWVFVGNTYSVNFARSLIELCSRLVLARLSGAGCVRDHSARGARPGMVAGYHERRVEFVFFLGV